MAVFAEEAVVMMHHLAVRAHMHVVPRDQNLQKETGSDDRHQAEQEGQR